MPDGPAIETVRRTLRRREDREEPQPTDAGPERDEDRAREMRERVEPPPAADDDAADAS